MPLNKETNQDINQRSFGGARGVMVIVLRNGHGSSGSKPGRG